MGVAVDLGPRAAVHLLGRVGYGPRPGEARAALERGLERTLLEQLQPAPDPELDARLGGFTTLGLSIGQVLAGSASDPRLEARLLGELQAAKLIRALHGRNQLLEVLTDFWFNHLNVFFPDGFLRAATHAYERDAIRPNALGRFRDLLGASARHPAMLFYLDNYVSTVARRQGGRVVGGLNENYGRELMELHTLGVDAGYTQQDVIDAARCLTGWGIDQRAGTFAFRPELHDREAKSVFGLVLPAGGGQEDGERLLDHLAAHPATARHVSFRLCQRFVADAPPAALVERCAATFLDTDGEIPAVLRTLFGSPEFWAEAFGPGKPKTALEYVASVLRAADAEIANARALVDAIAAMGMPLYSCAPPTGYPNAGQAWLNPSLQLARMNFALDLAAGDLPGVRADLAAASSGASASDPQALAAAMGRELLGTRVSEATLTTVGRLSAGGRPGVQARAVGLMLAGPDFQVR